MAGRAAVSLAAVIFALLWWIQRRIHARIQHEFDRRVGKLATDSRRTQRAERLRHTLDSALGLIRVSLGLVVLLFLLQFLLLQFPWTRGPGQQLFRAIASPLGSLGRSLLGTIPNLILLAILFFLMRYGLAIARLYFEAVEAGNISIRNFQKEWAGPTFGLVRVLIIGAVLVVAYPSSPDPTPKRSKAFRSWPV